eukprot:jgi/Botrbrau1/13867/Bobra.0056s0100.1
MQPNIIPFRGSSETSATVLLGPITTDYIFEFKRLTTVIFPVKYEESFYRESLLFRDFTRGAYLNGSLIGAVAVRLEAIPNTDNAKLYIMTLGVLAPYRGQGIGGLLLQHVLTTAKLHEEVIEAYLHVHTSNTDAIRFYKKYGFEERGIVSQYYRRLRPPDAVLLWRSLQTNDALAEQALAPAL